MEDQSLVVLPPELTGTAPRARGGFLLGIDGGATKTLAAVLDLDSGTVHLGHAGSSNEDAIGAEAAVRALLSAADEALGSAGIADEDLAGAVLAVAGTDTPAVAEQLRRTRSESWTVVNDVVGAWAVATGARKRCGRDRGHGVERLRGRPEGLLAGRRLGHILGDEGGAIWLGVAVDQGGACATARPPGPPRR